VGFQFLHYLVDSLAEVFGLEVSSRLRALVLLASIIISVYSFVVCKVDVLIITYRSCLFFLLLIEFVLIIWQLVQIILILVATLVKSTLNLFCMNSSLIYHFAKFENI